MRVTKKMLVREVKSLNWAIIISVCTTLLLACYIVFNIFCLTNKVYQLNENQNEIIKILTLG
jgi:hypothetical protein